MKEKYEYDLIPKQLGWSMKVIGKTRSGKTTFVVAFIEFFINYCNCEINPNIFVISPTFDQSTWNRIRSKVQYANYIEDLKNTENSIIMIDDNQVQLKGNKLLTEMILNKSHKNISIIQCEQYTQITLRK